MTSLAFLLGLADWGDNPWDGDVWDGWGVPCTWGVKEAPMTTYMPYPNDRADDDCDALCGVDADTDLERFADSECLRGVLLRICATPDGWNSDPQADDLLRFAADRFTALAVKHGLEPADALAASFEVLRMPSVRYGIDPWGVAVTAVATMFRAWQFADEALTSLDTARRGGLSGMRAERFSERDLPRWEHDPALAVDFDDCLECGEDSESITEQAWDLAGLFTRQGWPAAATRVAVEVVLRKLADAGSRQTAYEGLRRERRWRAITGLPAGAWTGLLRLLLGTGSSDVTDPQKGVLLRLALGETIPHLHADRELGKAIRAAGRGL